MTHRVSYYDRKEIPHEQMSEGRESDSCVRVPHCQSKRTALSQPHGRTKRAHSLSKLLLGDASISVSVKERKRVLQLRNQLSRQLRLHSQTNFALCQPFLSCNYIFAVIFSFPEDLSTCLAGRDCYTYHVESRMIRERSAPPFGHCTKAPNEPRARTPMLRPNFAARLEKLKEKAATRSTSGCRLQLGATKNLTERNEEKGPAESPSLCLKTLWYIIFTASIAFESSFFFNRPESYRQTRSLRRRERAPNLESQ